MNIKELAEQAGFRGFEVNTFNKELERFEELVRADERKACSKLCEELSATKNGYGCARAIRQRGDSK